jgi:DNA-binding phage protein
MDDLQKQIQKIKSLEKNFKIKELKEFNISEYLDNKEIRDEYLAQVLKDGDKDELSEALENIEKAKTLKS